MTVERANKQQLSWTKNDANKYIEWYNEPGKRNN